ncbi:MAG: RNA-binding protein involved in meiosis Mei2 [Amphiamblys sp. WSBS2006]|nr:MAG: RNA-binding protein involved in meiosis Mei2 [Amphiamblys sp. WSBS2006]
MEEGRSGFLEELLRPMMKTLYLATQEETRTEKQDVEEKIKTPRSPDSINRENTRDQCLFKDPYGVSIEILRRGVVKKTTFMIKNIPNKYTQKMFIETIDKTHRGLYNFVYLVFDFKNECNLGYAFINFVSSDAAILFIERYEGKKWPVFNSEKKCSLCYARIQGMENLIERFRNSKIMSEKREYQPKMFYTEGPDKGKEREFPAGSASCFPGRLHGRYTE